MNKAVSKIVTFLILSSLLLTGCKGSEKQNQQPTLLDPVNTSEKYETVEYRDIYTMKTYEAIVNPYSTELSFTTNGVFNEFYVGMGDEVKKGQILASQSDEEYEKELKQLQLNYEEIKTNYKNEVETHKIEEKLIVANLEKAKRDLEQADSDKKNEIEYTIEKLELGMKTLKKSAEIKRVDYNENLSECNKKIVNVKKEIASNNIVAPYDGIILIKLELEKGSTINSETPIIEIADTSKRYISCFNEQLYEIEQADKCYSIFDGVEYVIDYSSKLSDEIQNSTMRTVQENSRFTFVENEDKVNFGEVGLICLLFDYKENVLSASNKAIYTDGINKHYVYCNKDGKKEKVYVEIGTITNIYTEILNGLEEGDVIFSE